MASNDEEAPLLASGGSGVQVLGSCVRYIEIFLLFFVVVVVLLILKFFGLKHLEFQDMAGLRSFSEALALL